MNEETIKKGNGKENKINVRKKKTMGIKGRKWHEEEKE